MTNLTKIEMYMKKKIVLTLTCAFFAFSSMSFAKDINILTVDLADLYSQYNKAVEYQEKFTEAAKKAQDQLNVMLQEGMKMGEEYNEMKTKAENPALTSEAKEQRQKEVKEMEKKIENKQAEITQFQQNTTQTLTQRRQSVINLHLTEIKEVVAKIAKSKGSDMVLNSSGMLVLYQDPTKDITQETLKQLNSTPLAIEPPKSDKPAPTIEELKSDKLAPKK